MAKRSLQASQEGARLARKAFDRKGWTQENLAAELELKTRQPIWRFFTCRPVERHIFVELCHILDINWWEIADQPPEFLLEAVKDQQELFVAPQPEEKSCVELLVERVRASCQDWIENQCGVLRILDTSSPTCFDTLYVPVDIIQIADAQTVDEYTRLKKIEPQAELQVELEAGEFVSPKTVIDTTRKFRISPLEALQQQTKLRVLGKPGSGKTALLKYLALQCIRGSFATGKVPVFIQLSVFTTYAQELGKCSLFDFICYELSGCGIDNLEQTVTTLLTEGRFLLLFDALDEVVEPESYALYKEITHFVERYYKNQFVITARPTSDRFEFYQFTDAEIGAFTDEQLVALSRKWFKVFLRTGTLDEQPSTTHFLRQLRLPENQSIAALARLPLFFCSIAQLFQQRGELATHRLEIYEVCLNLLFERWDRSRGINRSASQPDVPNSIKQAVLVQIAVIGFQQNRFYFERREIIHWIEEYLYRLHPDATNSTVVQILSKSVLVALEHAHGLLVEETQGIFSFSFSGFQSYFTALWMAHCIISGKKNSDSAIAVMAERVCDPQWREAVLLSCELTAASDQVVGEVSQAIDRLKAEHRDLVDFMSWTQQTHLKSSIYQQIREGFVLWQSILRTPMLLEGYAYVLLMLHALAQQLLLEVLLDRLLKSFLLVNWENSSRLEKVTTLLERAVALFNWAGYESEFQALRSIKQNLPDLNQSSQPRSSWQACHAQWVKQLWQVVADWYEDDRYRNLTESQQQALEHYSYLSHLLTECVNLRSNKPKYSNLSFLDIISLCPDCKKNSHQISVSGLKKDVLNSLVL